MNRLLIILFALLAASPFARQYFKTTKNYKSHAVAATIRSNNKKSATLARLKPFATKLKLYAATNGFNSDYCFLVDMKIESGSNRFLFTIFKVIG